MGIKDISRKSTVSAADAIRVDGVPLPLLTNVVQLALSGIPNVTEMINAGAAPPESLNGLLVSIQGVLAAARAGYLDACETGRVGGGTGEKQGEALLHTIMSFEQCREYALSQVEQVH